jgi:hypothetical protein
MRDRLTAPSPQIPICPNLGFFVEGVPADAVACIRTVDCINVNVPEIGK